MKKTKFKVNLTAVIIGSIVVTLLLNAILITLNDKVSLQLDFTKDKLYELTDQTRQVIDKAVKDTEMIMLTNGTENEHYSVIENILRKYSQQNSKISVSILDANKSYADIKAYVETTADLAYGSVLIKYDNKHVVANAKDFYFQNELSYVERVCTNKLAGLVDESFMPSIALVVGHGEEHVDYAKEMLGNEGYKVSELDTLTANMPEDTNTVLMVNGPKVDFTAEEIDKLDNFLDRGGNVQIHFAPSETVERLEKLEGYLSEEWGITRKNNIVVDPNNLLGMGLLAQARLGEHEIVQSLAGSQMRVGYVNANTLEIAEILPQYVTVSSVLQTSEGAYAKTPQAIAAQESSILDTDPVGQFDVMVAASRDRHTIDNQTFTGKLLVSGSPETFMSMVSVNFFVNKDLLLNSIGWVAGSDTFMSIPAKQLPQGSLMISVPQYWTWFIILVAVVPLILFGLGLTVWLRRRYR